MSIWGGVVFYVGVGAEASVIIRGCVLWALRSEMILVRSGGRSWDGRSGQEGIWW